MTPPPLPTTNSAEYGRILTTARRVRMLGGVWKEDARRYIAEHFAREALDVLPPVSIERNPYRNIVAQLATLYDVPPEVSAPSSPGLDLAPLVTPKLKALWPQLLINVIGLNEALIRVDVHPDGRILYRIVTPDNLRDCVADPYEPDRIVALSEVRYLKRPGFSGWGLERWDVSDPKAPIFKVYEQGAAGPVDATALYYPDLPPGDFPYRDLKGDPVLPFALYHLRPGGGLFNAQDGEELVEATLGISVLATSTSPLSMLRVEGKQRGHTHFDLMPTTYDSVAAIDTLNMQEADPCGFVGLNPADMNLNATNSAAARVISQDALRRVRSRHEQMQRSGDLHLLTIAAKIYNASKTQAVYPESHDDWQIVYK